MPAEHVLLLPGLMCDQRVWLPQLQELGAGATVPNVFRHDSFAEMAEDVLAQAPTSFAVAGLSMGGILAFELWRQAPTRITHMALLDTNPHAEAEERKSLRLKQIEDVAAGRLEEVTVNALKPMYLARQHREDQRMLDTILQMAIDLGPEVFRRQSLALKDRADSVPTLSTIDCPVAVICGDEDSLCPLAYHELMAERIDGAELTVIESCGHLSPIEQPARVNQLLLQLFAK